MLLSEEDIARLEINGNPKSTFTRIDKHGYAALRNRNGHCVFFDPEKIRCRIYALRPAGCRVYPVILDEAKGIVTDDICRAHTTVTEDEKLRRGKKVVALLKRIDAEAKRRVS